MVAELHLGFESQTSKDPNYPHQGLGLVSIPFAFNTTNKYFKVSQVSYTGIEVNKTNIVYPEYTNCTFDLCVRDMQSRLKENKGAQHSGYCRMFATWIQ